GPIATLERVNRRAADAAIDCRATTFRIAVRALPANPSRLPFRASDPLSEFGPQLGRHLQQPLVETCPSVGRHRFPGRSCWEDSKVATSDRTAAYGASSSLPRAPGRGVSRPNLPPLAFSSQHFLDRALRVIPPHQCSPVSQPVSSRICRT